ncbi:hypothetical protein I553_0898, partial [Mycobacterium xenopi 4042]
DLLDDAEHARWTCSVTERCWPARPHAASVPEVFAARSLATGGSGAEVRRGSWSYLEVDQANRWRICWPPRRSPRHVRGAADAAVG